MTKSKEKRTPILSSSGLALAIVAVLAAIVFGVPEPTVDWDGDIAQRSHRLMGRDDATTTNQPPLDGLTVVITGATSGIGLGVTKRLSSMGAHVIAIGRSQRKLDILSTDFPTVTTVIANLNDLDSVSKAADSIAEQFDRIDVLINNAGIHAKMNTPKVSKQGYDEVFAVNYLSHFLLTEKMIPLLEKSNIAKIIQVSSLYSSGSTGTDLAVSKDVPAFAMSPIASRPGGSFGFWVFRGQRSYSNSKLAQMVHANALNRRKSNVHAVSVCPAWVGTNIAGHGLKDLFGLVSFDSNGYGIRSLFEALLGSNNVDESFYSNTKQHDIIFSMLDNMPSWTYSILPIRDTIVFGYAVGLLLFQKLLADVQVRRAFGPAYDEQLQDELYDWSYSVVKKWLS